MTTASAPSRTFVAGHNGMVGAAILRQLQARGRSGADAHIVTRTHGELDLTNQAAVRTFFAEQRIGTVYLAAARVGGIHANNTFPAEFIYENLMIEANVVHEAWRHGVSKLLLLGSSCIYPKLAAQPIREEYLLTGAIEPTNEPYAIAKIAGIKLCESYARQYGADFRSLMPTSLYGLGDNFHPENSHVIPALIRRFHEAKLNSTPSVLIWGSGTPRREFLYVDDMAAAAVHVMELDRTDYAAITKPMQSHINIGTGRDITIGELAKLVSDVVGYTGRIEFDASKPDGAPRKLLDVSKIESLGWAPTTPIEAGLRNSYQEFLLLQVAA